MAATLTFNGYRFAGTPESPRWTPPQAHVKTIKLWGLVGEGELNGGRGGCDIFVPCVVHGNYQSAAALKAVLKNSNTLIATVGTLKIVNPAANFIWEEPNCSFRGFTPDGDQGAGLVHSSTGEIKGWWVRGVLHFHQLRDF